MLQKKRTRTRAFKDLTAQTSASYGYPVATVAIIINANMNICQAIIAARERKPYALKIIKFYKKYVQSVKDVL